MQSTQATFNQPNVFLILAFVILFFLILLLLASPQSASEQKNKIIGGQKTFDRVLVPQPSTQRKLSQPKEEQGPPAQAIRLPSQLEKYNPNKL